MARKIKGRPIHGVLLINKPGGASSNRVLQQYKRALDAQKAGHTGALDPLATGLLPLCFGEATKFSQLLLESDKTYQATARLGARTDTCDADGEITETAEVPQLSQEQIEALIAQHFSGTITQVAPLYSALKVNGRPMYELARAGIEVEAKSRQVEVFSMVVEDIRQDAAEIDLMIHCSKGTYIRSIVDELGQLLGCGAHVSRLHRIQHGPFSLEQVQVQSHEQDQATIEQELLPVDCMIQHWPSVVISEEQAVRFLHGNPVSLDMADLNPATEIRVYQADKQFMGIGELSNDGRLAPRRVIRLSE